MTRMHLHSREFVDDGNGGKRKPSALKTSSHKIYSFEYLTHFLAWVSKRSQGRIQKLD